VNNAQVKHGNHAQIASAIYALDTCNFTIFSTAVAQCSRHASNVTWHQLKAMKLEIEDSEKTDCKKQHISH